MSTLTLEQKVNAMWKYLDDKNEDFPPAPRPPPGVCPPGMHWDLTLEKCVPDNIPPTANKDVFGIFKIYQDKVGGNSWSSTSWAQKARTIKTDSSKKYWQDPDDEYVWIPAVGDAVYKALGDGTAIFEGKSPRVTILKSWKDVESTVYCKPLQSPDNFDMRPKTEHYCVPDGDFGGYIGNFSYDNNQAGLRKEQTHALGYSKQSEVTVSIPRDKFVGFKVICYQIPNTTKIKLESYIDLTEGANGGMWKKIHERTDDKSSAWEIGGKVYDPYIEACKGSAIRTNSEIGFSSYQFKNWTIREITSQKY